MVFTASIYYFFRDVSIRLCIIWKMCFRIKNLENISTLVSHLECRITNFPIDGHFIRKADTCAPKSWLPKTHPCLTIGHQPATVLTPDGAASPIEDITSWKYSVQLIYWTDILASHVMCCMVSVVCSLNDVVNWQPYLQERERKKKVVPCIISPRKDQHLESEV